MRFCTAINCMDGRVQLPVINYLRERFGAEWVDSITEPGPNKILADRSDARAVDSIMARIRISVEKHGSVGIAVVGHHDCAGNPSPKEVQIEQIAHAVKLIQEEFRGVEVIGLWVDGKWNVTEV